MKKRVLAALLALLLLPGCALADMKKGDRGDGVRDLQQMLIDLGYLFDEADGAFGRNTEDAVKWYQREYDFAETGVADDELLDAIRAHHERMYAGGSETDTVFCAVWMNEDGTEGQNICETHRQIGILSQALMLSDDAENRKNALDLWKNEVNRLYALLLSQTEGNAAAAVAVSQAAFFNDYDNRRAVLELLYPDAPQEVAGALVTALRSKALELCAMTNTSEG